MEMFIGLVAVVLIFGGPVSIIIYLTWRRSKERMEMIKRGMNPVLYSHGSTPKVGSGDLKFGIIFLAVGIALALSATIVQRYYDRDLMMAAIIVSFIGASVLIFWWITRKERERVQAIYERQLERLADHYLEEENTMKIPGNVNNE